MSRCELSIVFDRDDRSYLGGEKVRGALRVLVREEIKSKGIRLSHRWRTHGRGNVQSGPEHVFELAGPQILMAGDQLEFPFEVTAPAYPVTYHGHLISIDHYVRAEVDVAWAINPSAEEEYILRPGAVPPQFVGSRDAIVSLKPEAAPGKAGLVGKIILSLLAIVILGALVVFAFFLIPILLVVSLFLWIRSKAVASRVGDVEVLMPHKIAAPEENWPVTVRFTAKKSFPINNVSVQIQGQEIAVSGSGSNRKTHTHVLYTRHELLRGQGLLAAGETVNESLHLQLPATNAFTFEESDNKIKWTAEVRIDIPRFPDWSKSEELQVVPAQFVADKVLQPLPSENARDSAASSSQTSSTGHPAHATDFRWQTADESPGDSDNTHEPLPDSPIARLQSVTEFAAAASVEELLMQLNSVDRHSPQRAQMIARQAGTVFDVSVLIDRISSSIGSLQPKPGYADGKTVVGTILGTQQAIEILTHDDCNEELEGFRRGDLWQSTVQLEAWDTLYHRIRARQIVESGGDSW